MRLGKCWKCLLVALFLVGCAAQVTPLGPNRYMVSKQGATIMASPSAMTAAAMEGATEYCAAKGLVAVVEDVDTERDWRDIPNSQITFRCLTPDAAKRF
jgi:hypothetical protein